MSDKVLFIDRDGTLIEEPEDNQVDALDKVKLLRGVVPALSELADAGYRFVMVTNQDGLGTESFPEQDFRLCQNFVIELFASQDIEFDEVFICPHRSDDACDCRKPRTGLLTNFLANTDLDMKRSAVIGDRQTDLQMAEKIGVPGFLISKDSGWADIYSALNGQSRQSFVERKTKETAIEATVNLDAESPININTGIGFLRSHARTNCEARRIQLAAQLQG